ncbi:MAG: hypothetical protein ACLFSR_03840 [Halomonas sp.]
MYLFTDKGAVSIVRFDRGRGDGLAEALRGPVPDDPLLVRSRQPGHIEELFPGAQVFATPGADYPFRAVVSRNCLMLALSEEALQVDYPNFKDRVMERQGPQYREAVFGVWAAWADRSGVYQERAVPVDPPWEDVGW